MSTDSETASAVSENVEDTRQADVKGGEMNGHKHIEEQPGYPWAPAGGELYIGSKYYENPDGHVSSLTPEQVAAMDADLDYAARLLDWLTEHPENSLSGSLADIEWNERLTDDFVKRAVELASPDEPEA